MSAPLFVVADTYALAERWARDNGHGSSSGRRWRYVRHLDDVRGYDGPGAGYAYVTAGWVHGRDVAERLAAAHYLRLHGFEHV